MAALRLEDEKHGSTLRTEYVESKQSDPGVMEKSDADSSHLSHDEDKHYTKPPRSALDLVTEVLLVEDDPTLNPWTFRMWFIGIGVSIFSGTITTINTFRPQAVSIHLVFVAVITYVLGNVMARILPSRGWIGRLLNPGPFNKKEHTAMVIMCAASGSTPEAMLVLAVQRLWYNMNPSPLIGVCLILSTQMLGYGVAGLLRKTLVYPTKMLYPQNLPTASLLENLHRDRSVTKKRMKVFYYSFLALFLWQAFPQYIMPLLAGISVFCLTNRHSLFITNLFGGSMANEGLGILSISLDWTMIGGGGNPLWMPFQTLMNTMVGYLLSIGIYVGLYYNNVWQGRKFPFISPLLFSKASNSTKYIPYNQFAILNKDFTVDDALLEKAGLPYLTASHALATTTINLAIMATVSHMALWHWNDIKSAFDIFSLSSFKVLFKPKQWDLRFWNRKAKKLSVEEAHAIDPHYGLMQAYDDVPSWWFATIWIISVCVGLYTSQAAGSTLPWWAFLLAIAIAATSLTFFAALTAMFGFSLIVQPLIQMIGAYILPGRPLANLYFSTFGFNSLYQSKHMLKDLKLGQYAHLAPKCTFTMQLMGTTIGCLMSYIMMSNIVTEKRDILLAIQGTNVWSGQHVQSINSAAITWGGLAKYLYSVGGRYQWVSLAFLLGLLAPLPTWILHKFFPKLRLDYWNTAIIAAAMGALSSGTHSGILLHYATGFFSQLYLRKYRTNWFIKYNYILSAGMDGGAAVIGFILTFTVFGAGGLYIPFPPYWGNNHQKGNYDYCMRDPGMGKKRAH